MDLNLHPVYDRFEKDPVCKSLSSFQEEMREYLIGVLNDLAGEGYVPKDEAEWNSLWLDIAVFYFRLEEDFPKKREKIRRQALSLPYVKAHFPVALNPAFVRS